MTGEESGAEKVSASGNIDKLDEKFFELTRAQIQHEDGLIHNRVTWLLTLQAFLFGGYGFFITAKINASGKNCATLEEFAMVPNALAIMALASSMALLIGISAAAISMVKLVSAWKKREVKSRQNYPQIIGVPLPVFGIYGGLIPTFCLPIMSAFIWSVLVSNFYTKAGFIAVLFLVVALCIWLWKLQYLSDVEENS